MLKLGYKIEACSPRISLRLVRPGLVCGNFLHVRDMQAHNPDFKKGIDDPDMSLPIFLFVLKPYGNIWFQQLFDHIVQIR